MSKPRLQRRDDSERARAMELVNHRAIQRGRACEGKTQYANQNDARNGAKRASVRLHRAFDTYKCPFADHYHITSLRPEEMADDDEGWQ